MKKLLMTAAFTMLLPVAANAQVVSKGSVQRLDLDQITLDSTVVTSTGAELNILDGVTATAAQINRAADNDAKAPTVISGTVGATCADNGGGDDHVQFISSQHASATITLPAATGTGCEYTFAWNAVPYNNGDVIQVTGNDSFNGVFVMAQDSANTAAVFETASDTDKLTFTSTTQGVAQVGAHIKIKDIATDKYLILDNHLIGTGTEATPGATGQRS